MVNLFPTSPFQNSVDGALTYSKFRGEHRLSDNSKSVSAPDGIDLIRGKKCHAMGFSFRVSSFLDGIFNVVFLRPQKEVPGVAAKLIVAMMKDKFPLGYSKSKIVGKPVRIYFFPAHVDATIPRIQDGPLPQPTTVRAGAFINARPKVGDALCTKLRRLIIFSAAHYRFLGKMMGEGGTECAKNRPTRYYHIAVEIR